MLLVREDFRRAVEERPEVLLVDVPDCGEAAAEENEAQRQAAAGGKDLSDMRRRLRRGTRASEVLFAAVPKVQAARW